MFTAVVTSLGLSLVFAALIIVSRETLADWLFGDAGYGDALAIAALNLPVATAAALARQIMRLRFQPWRFLISSTLGALVGAGAAVTAVVYFDLGVRACSPASSWATWWRLLTAGPWPCPTSAGSSPAASCA